MSTPTRPNGFLLQQHLKAASEALRAKDMNRAFAIGEQAVLQGLEHANLMTLAAHQRMNQGNLEGALPLLVRAKELNPRDTDVLNSLGLCLLRLGRAREALPHFDTALRKTPGIAMLHFNKALAYERLSQLDLERRELERVIAIEPRHPAALSLLAMLAADRNDVKAARDYAQKALALSPGEVPALMALATVAVGERDFAAARVPLDALSRDSTLTPVNKAIVQNLMGDVLDGEGKYAQAFAAYSASKATLKTFYAPAYENFEPPTATVSRLRGFFNSPRGEGWRVGQTARNGATTHVFLVGFPRSGTTLLEQVLASHPDVEAMEERDCLLDGVRAFLASEEGLNELAACSQDALEPYRQSYWQKVREFGHSAERPVFIDKMPLNTNLQPLIAKLFPQAKILFALRDPRDVVLSCFRRRIAMTHQMYELLTLEGIANYYDAVMALGQIYREKLGLETLDARHETLIAAFEAESRRICAFLGLEWNESMHDFASRARRSNIDTPSGAQIARGLSREGAGQWRNYAHALAPVMARIAPWVSRFGYPEN